MIAKYLQMDHRQNVKVSNVQLSPLQQIKISFGYCPCKLYAEQPLLFSLFLKKDNFQCLHVNGCSYIQMSDRDC